MRLSSSKLGAVALGLSLVFALPPSLQAEGAGDAGRVLSLVRADDGPVRAVDQLPPGHGIVGVMGDRIDDPEPSKGAASSQATGTDPTREPAPERYRATSWSAAIKLWKVLPAQRALLRAHEKVDAQRPPKLTDRTFHGLQSWLVGSLARWFDERNAQLAQADEAARIRGLDPQLLAAARATIADNTAAVYVSIPMPKELASDLQLAEMLRAGAADTGGRALQGLGAFASYEQCSVGPNPHVAAFCRQRRQVLRDTFGR